MTTAISKLKAHFVNWREWELNPVVVKELRQSVRSWAVTGMLLLFLAVLFCASLTFLVTQSFDINVNQRLGGDMFQVFMVILTGASLTFIPVYIGVRLAVERQESNMDLLYITTLTPERIIRGKFFCGAYVAVLFFSACMPFMVFTNLLRGVDLPTVFFVVVCLFLVVCAAIQVAIFLACLPISRVFKILVALFGVCMAFSTTAGLVSIFFEMVRSGVGSMMLTGTRFWSGFFTASGVILAAVVLLYYLSVALISPPSANRAAPVRIYITFLWVLGAAFCGYWTWKQHDVRFMLPWAVVSLVVLGVSLVVVVSNNDQLSLRVRQRIPRRALPRSIAFLFFNGAAGGFVWVLLLTAFTYAGMAAFFSAAQVWFPSFSGLDLDEINSFEMTTGTVILYALAYGLAGLLVHRQFFDRRPPRLAGVFAMLLPGAWALIPNIVLFFLNRLSVSAMERKQLGNMFNVFLVKEQSQKVAHLVFAAAFLVLMAGLNARWFARQVKEFKPPERAAASSQTAQVSLPPPLPGPTGVFEA